MRYYLKEVDVIIPGDQTGAAHFYVTGLYDKDGKELRSPDLVSILKEHDEIAIMPFTRNFNYIPACLSVESFDLVDRESNQLLLIHPRTINGQRVWFSVVG